MSNPQRLKKRSGKAAQVGRAITATLATNCDTALDILHACVATEVRCVAEIVRHVRSDPTSSKGLLEDILAIEQGHANELVNALRLHRVVA